MKTPEELPMLRAEIPSEELANALSHGLGCALAVGAFPLLAAQAWPATPRQAALAVFAATMLLMFVASALYHAAPAGSPKRMLRRLDHAAIFVFIAGSCTPFALGQGDGAVPPLSLVGVWAFALLGALLKLANRLRRPLASTVLFLAFGWTAAAAAWPGIGELPERAQALVFAGGAAYTIGCAFYLLDRRIRQGHLIWHLLVIAGSACHLGALLLRAA
jgi:hemolysin III